MKNTTIQHPTRDPAHRLIRTRGQRLAPLSGAAAANVYGMEYVDVRDLQIDREEQGTNDRSPSFLRG
jgi:hypothetical protein